MVSREQNLFASCFLQFFTDQDQIWCWVEAVKTEHSDTTYSEKYFVKGNNCCLTVDVDIHLKVHKPVFLTLGIGTVITKCYISIPVWMALTFIQCHRIARKWKLLAILQTNSWDLMYKFSVVRSVFSGEIQLRWFCKNPKQSDPTNKQTKPFNRSVYSDICEPLYFKLSLIINVAVLYSLILVELHSKPQGHEQGTSLC